MLVSGIVKKGLGLGKKIGTRTLNIKPPRLSKKLPFGVYAVIAKTPVGIFKGVAHYGPRPAVKAPISFEVHCFGLKKNLYGKKVKVHILKKIRNVKNFKTISALKKQIEKDKKEAMRILKIKLQISSINYK